MTLAEINTGWEVEVGLRSRDQSVAWHQTDDLVHFGPFKIQNLE